NSDSGFSDSKTLLVDAENQYAEEFTSGGKISNRAQFSGIERFNFSPSITHGVNFKGADKADYVAIGSKVSSGRFSFSYHT
ncbi:hypothetical protein ACPV4X_27255, partial [Vibrio owensii]